MRRYTLQDIFFVAACESFLFHVTIRRKTAI